MPRFLLIALLLLAPSLCMAHQCQPGLTLEKQFNDSQRVFLVYVQDTKLEEVLQKKMSEKESILSSDSVRLISAGYRVVEDYKGDKGYQPRLLDLLGIGTGYVGLTPGVYYLVFLHKTPVYETSDVRGVDTCTVPLSHYRLDVPQFQESLNEVRALAQKAESKSN